MATATAPATPDDSSTPLTSTKEKSTKKKSTKKKSTKKVPALKLTQGGAPLEWHVLTGVGYVHPQIPSPVGGRGEPSVEKAHQLARRDGCAVEVVMVTEAQARQGREARERARGAGITAARETRALGRKASASESDKVASEAAAAAAGKE